MKEMGVPPAHVFPFRHCEFLVTDMHHHLMTDDQIDEWTAAVNRSLEMRAAAAAATGGRGLPGNGSDSPGAGGGSQTVVKR